MAEEIKIGSLAKALSAARDKCQPAPKDAENAYHKYSYASAEAVITAANDALVKSDLALIPMIDDVRTVAPGVTVLDRTWILCHSSGESLTLKLVAWPIIPDKGRPLDKALAGALTASLSYRLRDLLMIPRVDPGDDISGRDDTGHANGNGANGNGTNGTNGHAPKESPKEQPKPAAQPTPTLAEQHTRAMSGVNQAKDVGNLDAWVKWAQQFQFTNEQKNILEGAQASRRAALVQPANNL